MQLTWLALAIGATVAYHLVLKVIPAGANPLLSLAVTYAVVTAVFIILFAASPGATTLRVSMSALNWTAIGLAASCSAWSDSG